MQRLLYIVAFLSASLGLRAERPDCCRSRRFFAAFETAYVDRERAGGSYQEGLVFGGRFGFDRVKPKALYWGVDLYYLSGTLMGQAASGLYAESRFQSNEVEGRLGWTFGFGCKWRPTFTPFIGYGYYNENNRFHCNCPMQVRFRAYYDDLVLGFLSSVSPTCYFTAGLNVKVGLVDQGRNRILGDPTTPSSTQITGNRPQYTVEVPLTLYPQKSCRPLEVSLVPFYRLRHFGGRENYPFDFFETRLSYYGARIELALRW